MIASTQTNHPIADSADAANTGSPVDQACAMLRAAGLRITQPRIAILQALVKRAKPASIEQLHEDLAGTACDLVTVYRCLAAFQEVGFVRRCYFENGTSLYRLQLDDSPVYHIVSRDGSAVETLDPALSTELRVVVDKVEESLRARGYTEVSHLVEFFANAPRAARVAPTTTPTPAAAASTSPRR
jgi:Fur family ferric uptake transcriptional regulator